MCVSQEVVVLGGVDEKGDKPVSLCNPFEGTAEWAKGVWSGSLRVPGGAAATAAAAHGAVTEWATPPGEEMPAWTCSAGKVAKRSWGQRRKGGRNKAGARHHKRSRA